MNCQKNLKKNGIEIKFNKKVFYKNKKVFRKYI